MMLASSVRKAGFAAIAAALVVSGLSISAFSQAAASGPLTVIQSPAIGTLNSLRGVSGYVSSQAGTNVDGWLTGQGIDPTLAGSITDTTVPADAQGKITVKGNTVSLASDADGVNVGYLVGDAQGSENLTIGISNVAAASGHSSDEFPITQQQARAWFNGTTATGSVTYKYSALITIKFTFTATWGANGMTITPSNSAYADLTQQLQDGFNTATAFPSVTLTNMSTFPTLTATDSSTVPYSFANVVNSALTPGGSVSVDTSNVVANSWLNDFNVNGVTKNGSLSGLPLSQWFSSKVMSSASSLSGLNTLKNSQTMADVVTPLITSAGQKGDLNTWAGNQAVASYQYVIDQLQQQSDGVITINAMSTATKNKIISNTTAAMPSLIAGGFPAWIAQGVSGNVKVTSSLTPGSVTSLTPTGITAAPATPQVDPAASSLTLSTNTIAVDPQAACSGDPVVSPASVTATATVVSTKGQPMAGVPVTFMVDPQLSVGSTPVVTNSDGVATAAITLASDSATAGPTSVTARVEEGDGISLTPAQLAITVAEETVVPPQVSITPSGDTPVLANGQDSYVVSVAFMDHCSRPLSGADAQFSVTGSAQVSSTTQASGADGIAKVTVTNTKAESVTVTALSNGEPIGAPIEVAFDAVPTYVVSFTVAPTVSGNVKADGQSSWTATISSTLNGQSAPLPNWNTQLALQPSSDALTVSALTDNSDGTYTAIITSSTPGSFQVAATYDSTSLGSQTVSFVSSGPSPAQSTLTVTVPSPSADCGQTIPITAQALVTDDRGTPMPGVDVTFTMGTMKPQVIPTGSDGKATLTINYTMGSSNAQDPIHATIDVNGTAMDIGGSPYPVSITSTGACFTTSLAVAPDSSPVYADGESTWTGVLTVVAANGASTAGGSGNIVVNIYAGSDPTGNVTMSSLTDNGDGTYIMTFTSAIPGDYSVQAYYYEYAATPQTITFTALTPSGGTITPNTQTVSQNCEGTQSGTVIVTATDEEGHPVAGAHVVVTVGNNAPETVITNPDGTKTISVGSSSPQATYTVSIHAALEGSTTELAGSPVTIVFNKAEGCQAEPSALTGTLTLDPTQVVGNQTVATATVVDGQGVPVSGVTVALTITGNAQFSNGTASMSVPTGADGKAVAIITTTSTDCTNLGFDVSGTIMGDSPVTLTGSPVHATVLPPVGGCWPTLTAATSPTSGSAVYANGVDTWSVVFTITRVDGTPVLDGEGGFHTIIFLDADGQETTAVTQASDITNNGDGTYTLLVASTVPGTYSVSVMWGDSGTASEPTMVFMPVVPSPTLSTLTLSSPTIEYSQISGDGCGEVITMTPDTATVTVKDPAGTPMEGVEVTFSSDDPTIVFTPASQTTNADGVASVQVTILSTANIVPAEVHISANVAGVLTDITGVPATVTLVQTATGDCCIPGQEGCQLVPTPPASTSTSPSPAESSTPAPIVTSSAPAPATSSTSVPSTSVSATPSASTSSPEPGTLVRVYGALAGVDEDTGTPGIAFLAVDVDPSITPIPGITPISGIEVDLAVISSGSAVLAQPSCVTDETGICEVEVLPNGDDIVLISAFVDGQEIIGAPMDIAGLSKGLGSSPITLDLTSPSPTPSDSSTPSPVETSSVPAPSTSSAPVETSSAPAPATSSVPSTSSTSASATSSSPSPATSSTSPISAPTTPTQAPTSAPPTSPTSAPPTSPTSAPATTTSAPATSTSAPMNPTSSSATSTPASTSSTPVVAPTTSTSTSMSSSPASSSPSSVVTSSTAAPATSSSPAQATSSSPAQTTTSSPASATSSMSPTSAPATTQTPTSAPTTPTSAPTTQTTAPTTQTTAPSTSSPAASPSTSTSSPAPGPQIRVYGALPMTDANGVPNIVFLAVDVDASTQTPTFLSGIQVDFVIVSTGSAVLAQPSCVTDQTGICAVEVIANGDDTAVISASVDGQEIIGAPMDILGFTQGYGSSPVTVDLTGSSSPTPTDSSTSSPVETSSTSVPATSSTPAPVETSSTPASTTSSTAPATSMTPTQTPTSAPATSTSPTSAPTSPTSVPVTSTSVPSTSTSAPVSSPATSSVPATSSSSVPPTASESTSSSAPTPSDVVYAVVAVQDPTQGNGVGFAALKDIDPVAQTSTPVPGVQVDFSIVSGPAVLFPTSSCVTNDQGICLVGVMNTGPGTVVVKATVNGQEVTGEPLTGLGSSPVTLTFADSGTPTATTSSTSVPATSSTPASTSSAPASTTTTAAVTSTPTTPTSAPTSPQSPTSAPATSQTPTTGPTTPTSAPSSPTSVPSTSTTGPTSTASSSSPSSSTTSTAPLTHGPVYGVMALTDPTQGSGIGFAAVDVDFVTQAVTPLAGVQVDFSIVSGSAILVPSASCVTDPTGTCAVAVMGGTGTIQVKATVNGQEVTGVPAGVIIPGFPAGTGASPVTLTLAATSTPTPATSTTPAPVTSTTPAPATSSVPTSSAPTSSAPTSTPSAISTTTEPTTPAPAPSSSTPAPSPSTSAPATHGVYYGVQVGLDGQPAGGTPNVVGFGATDVNYITNEMAPVSGVRADFTIASGSAVLPQPFCVTDETGLCTVPVVGTAAGTVVVKAFVDGQEVTGVPVVGTYASPVTLTFAAPGSSAKPSLTLDASSLLTSGTVVLSGTGWVPGESVNIQLHSDSIDLGTVTAKDDGTLPPLTVQVPTSLAAGTHTITATGSVSGSVDYSFVVPGASVPSVPSAPQNGTSIATGGAAAVLPYIAWLAIAMATIGAGLLLIRLRRRQS